MEFDKENGLGLEFNFSKFFERQDSVLQSRIFFRITGLTGFCTRNPREDGRSLTRHGGNIDVAAGSLCARLYVGQAMTNVEVHALHIEAASIIVDLHQHTILSGPQRDLNPACLGMLGCIRQCLLADVK